ncbi:MAG: hypothetical protein JSU70_07525 [Phycisphaerales bacterium]|nr:MAG: hypothetical protein JSU70_07525 [Phycisphaerales bacterium]
MQNRSSNALARLAVEVTVLPLLFLMGRPSLAQSGGNYELGWYTIDGGGGTSSGGEYVLTGTIGQPEADWCSGGPYEVLGGFWPGGPVETECFPKCHPDYVEWAAVGKPDCWCYERQCHGDADGQVAGSGHKVGFYHVGPSDLNILLGAWMVKEPPFGPGIASVENGICADFAHDQGGSSKSGIYRVGPPDLNILIANWLLREPPQGPGIEPDCRDCP